VRWVAVQGWLYMYGVCVGAYRVWPMGCYQLMSGLRDGCTATTL
jgi:hypothetical protein